MSPDIKDLYLNVKDDIDNAICRLEGDLYVSETNAEFQHLVYIYERLLDLDFAISNRLS